MGNTARLKSVRMHEADESTARMLTIDHASREVSINGERIELTATEFDILEFLERNPHQVVTYAEVITAVWGDARYFERHALEVQVSRLRTKLGESGTNPYFIETVRGYGYRFRKESKSGHMASIHYDAQMDIISAWVSTESRLMPPPPGSTTATGGGNRLTRWGADETGFPSGIWPCGCVPFVVCTRPS